MKDSKYLQAVESHLNEEGFVEELTEANFVVPEESEYIDFGEETEEWDISASRPGLWENIRRKKLREGKNYKPAKTEKEGRPSQEELKRAQSDKPSKSDPRRTPAPKKDQKKGSKKNKPDSAKNPSGKITFSKEVTKQLSNKVKEHNAKGKGSKATLGMLKAVYRRGAGAYSTSHAPKMSRHGWAIARVNAFLTLLRTGKPSNSAYKQDNDLLPKGHPRKSSAGMKKKYSMGEGNGDVFDSPKEAMKRAKELGLNDIHTHKTDDGETIYMPGKNHQEYMKTVTTKGPKYKKGYAGYKYEDPKTGEMYTFRRRGVYRKDGRILVPVRGSKAHKAGPMEDHIFTSKEAAMKFAKKFDDLSNNVHTTKTGDGTILYIPGKDENEFRKWYKSHKGEDSKAAEYQGRKVTLNKPFRTPDGPKKMSVYVKNEKGNVVKVNFGDPNMKIKKNIPERRKSFRARHNCDNPGPKWKARYWSCKAW
tara:strand:- start:595 stop:2022 length:1428 start_codon:yes stop_codon:yes gene_type:complete